MKMNKETLEQIRKNILDDIIFSILDLDIPKDYDAEVSTDDFGTIEVYVNDNCEYKLTSDTFFYDGGDIEFASYIGRLNMLDTLIMYIEEDK